MVAEKLEEEDRNGKSLEFEEFLLSLSRENLRKKKGLFLFLILRFGGCLADELGEGKRGKLGVLTVALNLVLEKIKNQLN